MYYLYYQDLYKHFDPNNKEQQQLNFDNLVILKNNSKLKVSQENIDKISPNREKIKAKKATEKEK